MDAQLDDLSKAIAEYELLVKKATPTPWFHTEYAIDEYGDGIMEIGPHPLRDELLEDDEEEFQRNAYYEDCMAVFYGWNHNCDANAKLAVLAVNILPRLIARVKELEAKTATGLSEDVLTALAALDKWRNRV